MSEQGLFIIIVSAILLTLVGFIVSAFWINAWYSKNGQGRSPYTGLPMRRTTEISYHSAEKILRYLYDYHQYDNRIFKLKSAAFCRETGRIFQNSITWYHTIKVDWTFISKRYPGRYVSWGSLSSEQQQAVREAHISLEGFQTDYSSPTPSPRLVESQYAFTIPGPLYIDFHTKVLVGWKRIPNTGFEVLIVQKPSKKI